MKHKYGKWIISYGEEDEVSGGINISNISNNYTLQFDSRTNMIFILSNGRVLGGLSTSDIFSHTPRGRIITGGE